MGERHLTLLSAQHPGDLMYPVLSRDFPQMCECPSVRDSLADNHLGVRNAGDAGQMGYGYDLFCL